MNLLRVAAVAKKCGDVSNLTIWRWAREDPTFPKPIKIGGGNVTGWIDEQVDEWLRKEAEKAAPPRNQRKVAA